MKPSHSKKLPSYFIVIAVLVTLAIAVPIAFLGGWMFGGSSPASAAAEGGLWTCAMHPQIMLPQPGDCPICAMKLIPALKQTKDKDPRTYSMTENAMKLADIQTTRVQRKYVTNTIRMVGKLDYDETRLSDITAWVPGRLDRLYVDYTGVPVKKGDHMVTMYSPDLVVAQKELILAQQNYERFGKDRNDNSALSNVKSAEEKLRLMGLLEEQIQAIKIQKNPSQQMTIYAPVGGIVIQKNANEGSYVQIGTRIYTIADLSQLWLYMEAYESDMTWLRYGQEVEFDTESYPGEIFKGRIAFIDPVLNEKTRTVKVRVNVENSDMRLKPGMFVRARVKSSIAKGGQVIDAALAGKWISPMHPEIVKDGPGKCDICGMALVPAEELGFVTAAAGAEPALVIPVTAPLITGKRAVVYLKVPDQKQPTFRGQEVVLGMRAGDYYIVRHGLEEGDLVVTSGNFKIDAALQIEAGVSMMNPTGGTASSAHQHGDQQAKTSTDDHTAHDKMEQSLVEIEVPAEFRVLLDPVYLSYLAIADALADDDLDLARQQLKLLLKAIETVGSESLEADGRGRWKTTADRIVFSAYETVEAKDRKATRKHFLKLSDAMLPLLHTFGHAIDQPLQQFHCSMAFDYKGASWLQVSSQARNPYFGPKMLYCGERKAVFHSQAPLLVPTMFRSQLGSLYDAYLQLQIARSQGNTQQASASAAALQNGLKKIDASKLDTRTSQTWQIAKENIERALSEPWQQLKPEQQKKRFESLSGTFLAMVDSFGHNLTQPLYKAYCFMAFGEKDHRGAFWLQADKEILNPYLAVEKQMLHCGNIKRTYLPAQSSQEKP